MGLVFNSRRAYYEWHSVNNFLWNYDGKIRNSECGKYIKLLIKVCKWKNNKYQTLSYASI